MCSVREDPDHTGGGPEQLHDILLLYSLALSVGTSLDLRLNCDAFLQMLMARRSLSSVHLWLFEDSGAREGPARLVYSLPESTIEQERRRDHPVFIRTRTEPAWTMTSADPAFEHVAPEHVGRDGAVAVYALGTIGVLELFEADRAEPFGPRELNQLRNVLGKFTVSIEGCLSHGRVRSSEQKYRSLFEESRDIVFMSSPEGKLLDINPAGVRLLGYRSQAEVLTLDIASEIYANPADWAAYKRQIEAQGHVQDYEIVLQRADRRRITVLETSSPVRNEAGEVLAYRGIMRDVTEQRELEQQFIQAQKMESLGMLAGGIAHDFNNLLTGILGYASLLKSSPADRHERYIDTIEQSARRAQDLTSQLLAFARGGKYNVNAVNINRIVRETALLLDRVLGARVHLQSILAENLPTVEVDQSQIQQVIMNLCVNGRDAMPDGGTLTIRTGRSDGASIAGTEGVVARVGPFVTISVTDSGIGMDNDTVQRVFEPFFTTKEKGQGTGLGLALVYGVVKNHNGLVEVTSARGMGTTFRVLLPVSGKPEVDEPVEEAVAPSHGREQVLVVDDDTVLRVLTREILENNGYAVTTAADGEEAIEAFRHADGAIDIVVLDMVMPKLDGLGTLRGLQEMDPEVKVILSTGYSRDARAQETMKAGVRGFVKKPYSPSELLAMVRAVLDA